MNENFPTLLESGRRVSHFYDSVNPFKGYMDQSQGDKKEWDRIVENIETNKIHEKFIHTEWLWPPLSLHILLMVQ